MANVRIKSRESAVRKLCLSTALLLGGATQPALAQTFLDLRLSGGVDLNIGGTPNLVLGKAFDFNNDGADDILYHNLGLPVGNDHYHLTDLSTYTFLFGDSSKPFDQDGKLVIGLDKNSEPVKFVAGDFNEDGLTDFVGGSGSLCGVDVAASNSMPLFLGQAEGGPENTACLPIAPPADMENALGSKIEDIQLADLNNDGHQDIVVHRSAYSYDPVELVIYLGRGNGQFKEAQFVDIAQPIEYRKRYWFRHGWVDQGYVVLLSALKVMDYDNDGDLDFVLQKLFAGQATHELFVYENNGDGGFSEQAVIVPPVQQAAGSNVIYTYPDWYLNASDSDATNPNIADVAESVLGITGANPIVKDFDGDGTDDFAITAPNSWLYASNALYIFFGTDGATFSTDPQILPLNAASQTLLTAGDFDANGLNDLLLVEPIPEWQGNTTITPVYNFGTGGANTDTGTNTDPGANTEPGTNTETGTNTGTGDAGGTAPAIDPSAVEVEFEGVISEVGNGYLVIGTITVWITDSTVTTTEGDVPFAAGQNAQAQGMQNPDGQVIGTVVEAW